MNAYSIREVAAAPGISVPGFSEGWIVQDSVWTRARRAAGSMTISWNDSDNVVVGHHPYRG